MIISADDAVTLLENMGQVKLVAVDGLPCSGKSILAAKLTRGNLNRVLSIDDFFLPQELWPKDIHPSFPFPFYRYELFLQTIEGLANDGTCSYLPFDWNAMKVRNTPRVINSSAGTVIVEGTSCLHPQLAPLYDLRLFVESDAASMFDAILNRDGNYFESQWRTLWLPSIDLYMTSRPQDHAHYSIRGRRARLCNP